MAINDFLYYVEADSILPKKTSKITSVWRLKRIKQLISNMVGLESLLKKSEGWLSKLKKSLKNNVLLIIIIPALQINGILALWIQKTL